MQDHQKECRRERNIYVRRGGEGRGTVKSVLVVQIVCQTITETNEMTNILREEQVMFQLRLSRTKRKLIAQSWMLSLRRKIPMISRYNGKSPVLTGYTSVTEESKLC